MSGCQKESWHEVLRTSTIPYLPYVVQVWPDAITTKVKIVKVGRYNELYIGDQGSRITEGLWTRTDGQKVTRDPEGCYIVEVQRPNRIGPPRSWDEMETLGPLIKLVMRPSLTLGMVTQTSSYQSNPDPVPSPFPLFSVESTVPSLCCTFPTLFLHVPHLRSLSLIRPRPIFSPVWSLFDPSFENIHPVWLILSKLCECIFKDKWNFLMFSVTFVSRLKDPFAKLGNVVSGGRGSWVSLSDGRSTSLSSATLGPSSP